VTIGCSDLAAGRSTATTAFAGSANTAQHMAISSRNMPRMCLLLLSVYVSRSVLQEFDLNQ
jgi:hypothetical protein